MKHFLISAEKTYNIKLNIRKCKFNVSATDIQFLGDKIFNANK